MSESEALKTRDEQTKADPPKDERAELEAKLKEVDALYNEHPSQELLNARLYALASLMKREGN